MKSYVRIVFAAAIACLTLSAQTVSSSLEGIVVDPADAVVANAPVTLTNTATKAVRTASTDNAGTYRFLQLDPGTYNLTVNATGFKSETQTGIAVAAQETHNGGKMILQLGSVSDSISVTAEAAQVQLASSEKAGEVDSAQLDDVTLKGRDLFGFMKLIPGVIDTSQFNRDVTSPNNYAGITINGNTSARNFTVDGVTDLDTGANGTVHYEPNMDAVQELKVLTSNYQAEFGRNSGGTITVITKNGTQEFHGTGSWNHRHEEFNANSWANDHTIKNGAATPIVPYRYNIETYSLGGPVFIPKHLNKDRKRLFFFVSQEYTGQFVTGGAQSVYAPTALERTGDFSKSLNNNGTLITITDPTTGKAFSGNAIPSSRISPVGLAMLNFFPLPNYTPTLAAQLNIVNYFEQASATHPRRNDVIRLDTNITSKISGYARWINDHDDMIQLYQGVQFSGNPAGRGSGLPPISTIDHPNPGHGFAGTVTYTISPTMVNEATLGYSWNSWAFYSNDKYASEDRGLLPGVPSLFPIPTAAQNGSAGPVNGYQNLLPEFSFGAPPTNSMSYTRNSTTAGAYENFNPQWSVQDNLSKIVGHHSFKTGFYFEYTKKIQPRGLAYEGIYNFATSTANPLVNTGDGYLNALLGNVNSYTQTNATTTYDVAFRNLEFYIQDNWKVNRRLTLDLGVRFYHQSVPYDLNHTYVNFKPSAYSASAIPRIYVPSCSNGAATCSGTTLVAKDPATGATVAGGFVGDYVPGTGNPADGMVALGVNGVSSEPYHTAPIAVAPRLGFAYDLMGDGKTAIRGGWGVFYNRLQGNITYTLSGQSPSVYSEVVNYESFAQIAASNTGAPPSLSSLSTAPNAPNSWPYTGNIPFDAVQNASLDIQRNIGKSTVVDIGYTINYGYNQYVAAVNQNPIPIGTQWPFTPSNVNPTTGNSSLPNVFLVSKFPGLGSVNAPEFVGHTNYNALTASLNKRVSKGLTFGLAYTYSKSLGTTAVTPAVLNNESWNYGRLATDRRNNLQISYNYDIPGIAKKLDIKGLGLLTDHWSLSGATTIQSGAPFNPSCTVSTGTAPNYTGTPDATARCQVLADPLANLPANGNGQVYLNPAAFALPALATGPNNSLLGPPVLGNLGGGAGVLSLPHYTNFDLTLSKNIPLGNEKRSLRLQAQAYNAFNHTEISGIGTGILLNPTTGIVNNTSSLGYVSTTFPNRVLAFSAKIQF